MTTPLCVHFMHFMQRTHIKPTDRFVGPSYSLIRAGCVRVVSCDWLMMLCLSFFCSRTVNWKMSAAKCVRYHLQQKWRMLRLIHSAEALYMKSKATYVKVTIK